MHQPSVNWISVCEAHVLSTQLTPPPVPGAHTRLICECLGHAPPSSGGPGAVTITPCMRIIRPTKRIHGPCVPAPFVLGGYANSRLGALGQNTCLCRKAQILRVTTYKCCMIGQPTY
jgi:hypothetical protein